MGDHQPGSDALVRIGSKQRIILVVGHQPQFFILGRFFRKVVKQSGRFEAVRSLARFLVVRLSVFGIAEFRKLPLERL